MVYTCMSRINVRRDGKVYPLIVANETETDSHASSFIPLQTKDTCTIVRVTMRCHSMVLLSILNIMLCNVMNKKIVRVMNGSKWPVRYFAIPRFSRPNCAKGSTVES